MADDKHRAEIEAVEHVLKYGHRHKWTSCPPNSRAMCSHREAFERAMGLLDRVRDARHDDEPQYSTGEFAKCYVPNDAGDDEPIVMPERVIHNDIAARERLRAARSPQGEDHEAEIAAIIGRYARTGELRAAREVLAYLSRVSPSRDGSVAVEAILDRIIDAASRAGADGVLPAETVRVECLRATYALHGGDVADDVRVGDDGCDGTVAVEDVEHAKRMVLAQVDSLIDAIYDPNDVGPLGMGWRGALNELRQQIRLRWAEFSPASTGDREEKKA